MKTGQDIEQESVWKYPRPPSLVASDKLVVVEFAGERIAETQRAYRILETSHPPTWYIHPDDIRAEYLQMSQLTTTCEFKGRASYVSLVVGEQRSENAGWYYHEPTRTYLPIRDHVAFYPGRVDACYVNGERVKAQAGDFYGGWITADIAGPFKGGTGTHWW